MSVHVKFCGTATQNPHIKQTHPRLRTDSHSKKNGGKAKNIAVVLNIFDVKIKILPFGQF